jgi:polyisoprenoid-binding protein YceI
MKQSGESETASSRDARRRIEHEAEGGASGALAGAIVGAAAGAPGAIAGAIMGGIAGALAGAVLDQESTAKQQRIRDLDEEVRVSGGALGAPIHGPMPTTSGASAGEVPVDGVTFSVRTLLGAKIMGRFTMWRGSLLFDEKAPQNSRVAIEIDVASIDTNEPLRDAHLRSAEFFDVEKHPTLVFRSTKVERARDGFKVAGDLTMHGITRPLMLHVQHADQGANPPMGPQAAFFARGSLSRKNWGLSWNRSLAAGEMLIGDEVEIALGIRATRVS